MRQFAKRITNPENIILSNAKDKTTPPIIEVELHVEVRQKNSHRNLGEPHNPDELDNTAA